MSFLTANSIAIKACRHQFILVKLNSEFCSGQQYRDLCMSISNNPRKIELSLFWRSTVWHSRHVDIKLCSQIWIPNFVPVNSIAIYACRCQVILIKLNFNFSDGQQHRNWGMSISNYPRKIDFWIWPSSTVSRSRRANVDLSEQSGTLTDLVFSTIRI